MKGSSSGADATLAGFVSGDDVDDPRTAEELPPPRIAGRYEILGLIGAGGMGRVYRARDIELDEVVAIKLLRTDRVADAGTLARFRQEVKLARRVTHPNVVRTFDLGEHEENGQIVRFLTMEYVEGASLARVLTEGGPLAMSRVVALGSQIATAVAAAHAAGVLHRDLKPDNVLIAPSIGDRDEHAMITDFGIARASVGDAAQTGTIMGTPAYMAPEQVRGGEIGPAADVYAVGAILFEMVTGRRAFVGTDALAVASARLFGPPPDPRPLRHGMSDALAQVITRCLALEPRDRYAGAADIGRALAEVSVTTPTSGLRPVAPALPFRGANAIAVLPIRNAGPPDDEYLAAGTTEEILDTLALTPGLRLHPVRGIDAHADPRETGRRVGADVVLDGSIRRLPDGRMRLGARLISVSEGFQLWGRRVDGPPTDLVMQAADLAREVALALAVHIQASGRGTSTDPVAVELYLRARQAMREAWNDDLRPAISLLDQAVAIAPDDPAILSAFATTTARATFLTMVPPEGAPERMRRAVEAAERAIALAPHLGEPWTAIATVRAVNGDTVGAATAAKMAVTRAPGLLRAQEMVASMLLEAGRIDEAIERFRTIHALDPDYGGRFELARAYALKGRWADADAQIAAGSTGPGTSQVPRRTALERYSVWNPARPVPEADAALDGINAYVAQFLTVLNRLRAGEPMPPWVGQILREQTRLFGPRTRALQGQIAAEMFAFSGDPSGAIEMIGIGLEGSLYDITWMDLCPVLAIVREHPGWSDVHARVAERARAVARALDAPAT